MRQVTKNRQYGKIDAIQSLTSTINYLTHAKEAWASGDHADVMALIDNALAAAQKAAWHMGYYRVPSKRVLAGIEREIKNLETLREEARAIPITPEQKAEARRQRSLTKA